MLYTSQRCPCNHKIVLINSLLIYKSLINHEAISHMLLLDRGKYIACFLNDTIQIVSAPSPLIAAPLFLSSQHQVLPGIASLDCLVRVEWNMRKS